MATTQLDESAQFQEPISPTASNTASTSEPSSTTQDSAKPSITGILKKVVHAPSHAERVNEEQVENAIQAVGDDGQKKGIADVQR
ncbi:hypothetical protein BDU57DRAFT_508918 [Ampelomyces quisqualis]|uniref:Uncharacterized protein n=1 Tax=Ampelomyces quisqualis TaxID=50730 RepID=A0A6A5QXN4_AMPQU|nr:hypothetical protein BDU57DRAFT_508918 [Ampelomyces quisqualis]